MNSNTKFKPRFPANVKVRLDKGEREKIESIKLFLIERGNTLFHDAAILKWALEKAYIDARVKKIFSYEMDFDEEYLPLTLRTREFDPDKLARNYEKQEEKPTDWTIPEVEQELIF